MKRGILFLALAALLLSGPARAAMLPDGSPMDRFANLTEAEREQIYALSDRFCEAACSLLEKYAELGVLGSETAGKICRDLREHLKLAQQDQQPFGDSLPVQRPVGRLDVRLMVLHDQPRISLNRAMATPSSGIAAAAMMSA